MISVDIINEQVEKSITDNEKDLIETVIINAAKFENITDGEVVITLVDNEAIQSLNKEYRGIDRPTDVLSFAMNETNDDDLEIFFDDEVNDIPNMLGDIIISIPKAIEQSIEYGHSFERELGFLAVHGFLHLIGYDHQNENEEKEMFSRQELILTNINLIR